MMQLLLTALLTQNATHADDLASLQGKWVSEDFAWTVEFRESTAIFRGVNPFHNHPQTDEVYPELSFRFTLDAEASPRQLDINEEDFARFRKMLKPSGAMESHEHAKPFRGIYSIGPANDGKLPTEMQLELYSQTRHWKTKGFNESSSIYYLGGTPTRKLRRISDAEADLYRRLSGVWQGAIQRDGVDLGPPESFAVIPGWVVSKYGQMQLTFEDNQRTFTMKQTTYRESSPLAYGQGVSRFRSVFGEGVLFPKALGGGGPFGMYPSRTVTTDWHGTFQFVADDELAIEVSPFPRKIYSLTTGKLEDFDVVAKSASVAGVIAGGLWVHFTQEQLTKEDLKVLSEYQRIYNEGYQATMLTIRLSKMKQPNDEHPLTGLIRARHPDYPTEEFLEGTWRLKSQAQFDQTKSDPTRQYSHYEPVDIADAETWAFEPGRLSVKSASGARDDKYIPSIELKNGHLLLHRHESDDKPVAFFQARIVDGDLVLQGSFFERTRERHETWQYTLQRLETR
ncbi:MAG: hypothetical protein JNM43_01675 [Planctomycetaceae bacterium]|nr:hypothetical protein [Planctomycetaceae bacterium]